MKKIYTAYVGPFGLSEENDRALQHLQSMNPLLSRMKVYKEALMWAKKESEWAKEYNHKTTIKSAFNRNVGAIVSNELTSIGDMSFYRHV